MFEKKQEKNDKISRIKRNVAETERLMGDNLDLLINRGEKLELIEDRSKEIEKNALEFTHQARQLSIWAQFKRYNIMAILAGMTLGALFGVASGWYWPFLIASAVVGGTMAYSLMWMVSGITQSFFRFKFWSSSAQTSQQEMLTQTFKSNKGTQPMYEESNHRMLQFQSTHQRQNNENTDDGVIRREDYSVRSPAPKC